MEEMKNVDPRTVNIDDLVDLRDVKIDPKLPKEERIRSYIEQIKNPYCYLYKGMVIKICFSGKRRLEDCLKACLFTNI